VAQAADTQAVAASLVAYRTATASLRDRLAAYMEVVWRGLGIYRNAQAATFAREVVPVVQAAQVQMSSLTSGYLANAQSYTLGIPAQVVAVDPREVSGAVLRNGVPPVEVYERPFHQVWRDLSQGTPVDKAVEAGMRSAVSSALTDVQLAKTHTAQKVIDRTKITAKPYWYKRVLEGPASCGLCVVASTQAYHVGTLLPIHPGCDCDVEPQWTAIPGHVIDQDTLDAAHAAVEETFGISDWGGRNPDYRKILLVREHGELGPVLTVKDHRFTKLDAPKRNSSRKRPAASLDSQRSVESLRSTLAALEASDAKFSSPGTRARLAELRAEIARRT
jgi:hypothetical protein